MGHEQGMKNLCGAKPRDVQAHLNFEMLSHFEQELLVAIILGNGQILPSIMGSSDSFA